MSGLIADNIGHFKLCDSIKLSCQSLGTTLIFLFPSGVQCRCDTTLAEEHCEVDQKLTLLQDEARTTVILSWPRVLSALPRTGGSPQVLLYVCLDIPSPIYIKTPRTWFLHVLHFCAVGIFSV